MAKFLFIFTSFIILYQIQSFQARNVVVGNSVEDVIKAMKVLDATIDYINNKLVTPVQNVIEIIQGADEREKGVVNDVQTIFNDIAKKYGAECVKKSEKDINSLVKKLSADGSNCVKNGNIGMKDLIKGIAEIKEQGTDAQNDIIDALNTCLQKSDVKEQVKCMDEKKKGIVAEVSNLKSKAEDFYETISKVTTKTVEELDDCVTLNENYYDSQIAKITNDVYACIIKK